MTSPLVLGAAHVGRARDGRAESGCDSSPSHRQNPGLLGPFLPSYGIKSDK